jgi:predicted nucleotidyltransferase
MLRRVARALGSDLLDQVAFVGGCTTGLLLTDEFTRERVRSTHDVDLVISVLSYVDWQRFKEALKKKGFQEPSSMDEEMPICAMKLGELRVDLMPDHGTVLGFSNRWYPLALKTAEPISLDEDLSIHVVTPPLFAATKLEAYKGRGEGDPLSSHDIEDILNLVDGRPELLAEVQATDERLQTYIAAELNELLRQDEFGYAVQSQAGDPDREALLFERLEILAGVGR